VLTQRHSLGLVLALLLLVSVNLAEAQYCPSEPKWDAVPCSIYNVWDHKRATDNAYTLQRVSATANFRRWSWESNYGPPIEIAIWNYRGWREQDYKAAANMLAQALAVLPPVVLEALPTGIILELETPGDCAGDGGCYALFDQRFHFIEFRHNYVHLNLDRLDWSFEELLVHEIGHLLDRLSSLPNDPSQWDRKVRWSDSAEWREAASGRTFVSDYAKRGGAIEDFAESFTAWAGYRTSIIEVDRLTDAHRWHIAQTLGERLAFFDRQF